MTKLLQVTTVAPTLAHFLTPVALHFRQAGWTVDGAATGASTSAACRSVFDNVYDIGWNRNPWSGANLRGAVAELRAIVARGAYDLVHVHTPVAAWVTRFALRNRAASKPVLIYTAHGFHFYDGGNPLRNTIFRGLERLAGSWTDYLVVINREDERAAVDGHIVPADRACYMPGIGIDRSQFSPDKVSAGSIQSIRAELGLTGKDILLLMIAEFIPRKAHVDAIHALAKVSAPHVHLAFAGAGPTEPEMKKLAASLKLESRTHFLGPRGDIPALICASQGTVLPSRHEGLSRSVLESLCLGVPVIGADVRGIRDLLRDGGGLLVPFGDRAALTDAMDRLAREPERWRPARDRLGPYDLTNILHLHERLYQHALEN